MMEKIYGVLTNLEKELQGVSTHVQFPTSVCSYELTRAVYGRYT